MSLMYLAYSLLHSWHSINNGIKEEEGVLVMTVGFMRWGTPEEWMRFKFVCTHVCLCTRNKRLSQIESLVSLYTIQELNILSYKAVFPGGLWQLVHKPKESQCFQPGRTEEALRAGLVRPLLFSEGDRGAFAQSSMVAPARPQSSSCSPPRAPSHGSSCGQPGDGKNRLAFWKPVHLSSQVSQSATVELFKEEITLLLQERGKIFLHDFPQRVKR